MRFLKFKWLFYIAISWVVVACSGGSCANNITSTKIYTFPNGAILYGNTNFNISAGSSKNTTYSLTGGVGNADVTLTTSNPLPILKAKIFGNGVCYLCGSFNPESLIIQNGNQESSSILTLSVESNLPAGKYSLDLFATYSHNGINQPTIKIGQIIIQVAANTSTKQYIAFITEQESGVLYCPMQAANGTIGNCLLESAPQAANSWSPTGLAITQVNGANYAYVVDASANSNVWVCPVNNDGSFGTCINAYTYSAGIGTYYQISFATVNGQQYAYMADSSTWITKCTVENNLLLDNCTNYTLAISTLGALQAYGVTIQNIGESQYAYISDVHPLGDVCHEFKCSIESDGGIQDNCVDTSGGQRGASWCPRTASFNSYNVNATPYAYVSSLPQDGSSGAVYQCSINVNDGTFNQCTTTPNSTPAWYPYMTAFSGVLSPYIYAISRQTSGSGNNDIYSCAVDQFTGLIQDGSCNIQQSYSAATNLADAIVVYGF